MQHEVKKYLYDIQLAIADIESFVKNKTYEELTKDSLLQSGLERKFEIIGEALYRIKRIDEILINKITDAHKIIGFRNIIAQGYDIIDAKIIYDAIEFNLPKLKSEINNLIKI